MTTATKSEETAAERFQAAQKRREELSAQVDGLTAALKNHKGLVKARLRDDAIGTDAYTETERGQDRRAQTEIEAEIREAQQAVGFVDEHLVGLEKAARIERADTLDAQLAEVNAEGEAAGEAFVQALNNTEAALHKLLELNQGSAQLEGRVFKLRQRAGVVPVPPPSTHWRVKVSALQREGLNRLEKHHLPELAPSPVDLADFQ